MGEEVGYNITECVNGDMIANRSLARYKWSPIKARKIVYNPPIAGIPRDRPSAGH